MAETNPGLDTLANLILDSVPLVMRTLRCEMRRNRETELSVPQFRILSFVHRRGSSSLSEIAEHMGLTLPSMSKMVDGLVMRSFVTRSNDASDRRRLVIALTERGTKAWESAREATRVSMVKTLATLSGDERRELGRSMEKLRELFSTGGGK